MKKLLCALAMFLSLSGLSQKIVVTKTSLTVNSVVLSKDSTEAGIIKALGNPEEEVTPRFIFNYPSKGLVVTGDWVVKKFRSIALHITASEPGSPFSGSLAIGSVNIRKGTTMEQVKKIPGIKVLYAAAAGMDCKYGVFRISLFYSASTKSLQTVTIQFDEEE